MSLLTFAPPPRVTAYLQRGRQSGGRLLSPRGSNNDVSPKCTDKEPQNQQQHVVVLGGGFGGVYTALRLAELAGTYSSDPNPLSITVVDARDRFVFLPLLYELATGTASESEVAPLLTDVLGGSGANFLQGTVTAVNLEKRTVTIGKQSAKAAAYGGKADNGGEAATWPSITSSDGVGGLEATETTTTTTLSFDRLVVAMGAEAAPPLTVPGAIEHAMPFYTVRVFIERKERHMRARRTRPSAHARQSMHAPVRMSVLSF